MTTQRCRILTRNRFSYQRVAFSLVRGAHDAALANVPDVA